MAGSRRWNGPSASWIGRPPRCEVSYRDGYGRRGGGGKVRLEVRRDLDQPIVEDTGRKIGAARGDCLGVVEG